MMQIALSPELEDFVQRQLENGKYSNQEDLVLAALALLKQQEDVYKGRLVELQQAALIGLEDASEGRVVNGPNAITQIKARLHAQKELSGE